MDTQQTPHVEKKTSRVLFWSVVLGFIIVLNLFFNYSASLVFHRPVYEAFCPISVTEKAYTDKNSCINAGGSWSENVYPYTPQEKVTQPAKLGVSESVVGTCNPYYTCQQNFDTANKVYDRNIFIVLVILGILSIVLGFSFARISSISLGLSLGGVLSLVIGSMRYWSDMNDIVRVCVLAFALATLVWLGVKKIKE